MDNMLSCLGCLFGPQVTDELGSDGLLLSTLSVMELCSLPGSADKLSLLLDMLTVLLVLSETCNALQSGGAVGEGDG